MYYEKDWYISITQDVSSEENVFLFKFLKPKSQALYFD